jgi:hypothetical protein
VLILRVGKHLSRSVSVLDCRSKAMDEMGGMDKTSGV